MGKVLSWTTVQASNNQFFKTILPFHVGMIKLDCGPVLIAYLSAASLRTRSRVRVAGKSDKSGQTVFLAAPPDRDPVAEFSGILVENAGG